MSSETEAVRIAELEAELAAARTMADRLAKLERLGGGVKIETYTINGKTKVYITQDGSAMQAHGPSLSDAIDAIKEVPDAE